MAAVFFAVVVFLAPVLEAAVFLAAVFFPAAFLASGCFSSGTVPAPPSASPAASAVFFFQPPRFSSGVKLGQPSWMQKGFLKPRPDFLNMVQPHSGQLSFTGTSQVIKSHLLVSSLLLRCSQQ